MNGLLRRLRGAAGLGLVWAVGWVPVGAVAGFLTGLVMGYPLAGVALSYATMFGGLGFVGGAIFSGILRLAEGRRRFDELSVPRFAAWGALDGLLLGGLAVSIGLLGAGASILGLVMAGSASVLGAASAAGTLALARASDDGGGRIAAGEDIEDVGLSAEDVRSLLGDGD